MDSTPLPAPPYALPANRSALAARRIGSTCFAVGFFGLPRTLARPIVAEAFRVHLLDPLGPCCDSYFGFGFGTQHGQMQVGAACVSCGPGSRDAGLATRYDYGGSSSVTDLAGTALTKPSFVNSGGVWGFGAQGVRQWSLRLIATDETRSLTKRHTRPTFLLDPNLSERDGTRGITSHHAGALRSG